MRTSGVFSLFFLGEILIGRLADGIRIIGDNLFLLDLNIYAPAKEKREPQLKGNGYRLSVCRTIRGTMYRVSN